MDAFQKNKCLQRCIIELNTVSNNFVAFTMDCELAKSQVEKMTAYIKATNANARMSVLRRRLQRFNDYFNQTPNLCAEAARKRATRIEKECCRRVCHRHNIDAARSIVLSFL
jgi:hypothetical protein